MSVLQKTKFYLFKSYLPFVITVSMSLFLFSCLNNIGKPSYFDTSATCILYPVKENISTQINNITTISIKTCNLDISSSPQIFYECIFEVDNTYTKIAYSNLRDFIIEFSRPGHYTRLSESTYTASNFFVTPNIQNKFTYSDKKISTQNINNGIERVIFTVNEFNDNDLIQNMSILSVTTCKKIIGYRIFSYTPLENEFSHIFYKELYEPCTEPIDPTVPPIQQNNNNTSRIYNSEKQLIYEAQMEENTPTQLKKITILTTKRICTYE